MQYNYKRRASHEVKVGGLGIGGNNPVRLQSMTNTDTNDVEGSALQAIRIAEAGGELVRLTTQGVREASALGPIKEKIKELLKERREEKRENNIDGKKDDKIEDRREDRREDEIEDRREEMGCGIPLSADVHFNPKAAFEAALWADKVRINPGNFVDAARTFRKLEFTDEEYAAEIKRIEDAFIPFLNLCKERGVSIRLGVNHGSLSDRIMSRYGDTPAGMVESVMEFLRICRKENFDAVVISIKASNTAVMTATVRLLVEKMDEEGMTYPLHLGVTEAGDAEDGRIKSAVGIGALMAEGIGDTIRVSLSEPPENEIPVAAKLRDYFSLRENHAPIEEPQNVLPGASRDYAAYPYKQMLSINADAKDMAFSYVFASDKIKIMPDYIPVMVHSKHVNAPGEIASYIDRYIAAGGRGNIVVSLHYEDTDLDDLRIKAAADFGYLLLNGYANGIEVDAPAFDKKVLADLELSILQATRLRMSKTEYIACPSCGRTLFDLQATLKEVKEATKDLKGLKIGVMGCIVNGPGEMADADYGYVGAGPGRVSIYKGKECVKKNIPTAEALPALLDLIKKDGH